MIQEDYVNFETAKLLKEKGFDEKCRQYYYNDNLILSRSGICNEELYNYKEVEEGWSAPTLQMAMKWLRKTHNFFIGVNTVIDSDKIWGYEVFIQKQEVPIPSKIQWDWFPTYEEACEAAIKYCLENLI